MARFHGPLAKVYCTRMVIETFMAMNVSDLCQHGTAGSKTSISTSGPVNCRNSLQCPAVVGVFDPVRDAITDMAWVMPAKHSIIVEVSFRVKKSSFGFSSGLPSVALAQSSIDQPAAAGGGGEGNRGPSL